MTDIQMPRLSDTMEEGVIARWHKAAGDPVGRGDVLAEIETDKAVMELEAFDEGVLEEVLVGEGEKAPIGTPIAVLGDGTGSGGSEGAGGSAADASPEPAAPVAEAPAEGRAPASPEPEPAARRETEPFGGEPAGREPAGRPRASPLARAVARDAGVDLTAVEGSGPGGRIIRADVEAAAEAQQTQASQQGQPASAQPASSQSGAAQQSPVAQSPVAQSPVAQSPVAQSPTAQSPTAQSPTAQPSAAQSPTAQSPTAQSPTAQSPAAQSPAAQSSAAQSSAAQSPAASEDVEEVPLSSIRKVAARRMTESKQQAPHFYLTSAVDVTDLVSFRTDLNGRLQAAGGPKVSVNDLVVKAVATALRANPSLNVTFAGDKVLRHKRISLGVAVALDEGLVVPVIPDTDRKSVSEIAAEGREKAGRAREGRLRPDEMSGGTFSISNLGMFGIEQFSAVINPPEAGILAVGAAEDEVRVRDGEFAVRTIMRVTLSADHRAVDGAVGAVFLQQLTALLEDPIRIIA